MGFKKAQFDLHWKEIETEQDTMALSLQIFRLSFVHRKTSVKD